MNVFTKVAAACVVSIGSAAMVGCDETVKKDETVRTNSDGSKTESTTEVKKDADGVLKKTEETIKTPASAVNH